MILGINLIGHDPGFAVVSEGAIVSVLEMERINGDRFGLKWPLSSGKAKGKNIQRYVGQYLDATNFFWNKYASSIEKIAVPGLYTPKKKYQIVHELYVQSFIDAINSRYGASISSSVFNIKHHMSHAALAGFTSPFDSSIIVSMDGQGNDGFFRVFRQTGNKIAKIADYKLCVGMAYEANTKIIDDSFGYLAAGKLMGLSAYGNMNSKYYKQATDFIKNYSKKRVKIWKNRFPGVKSKKTQDWMCSFQEAWSDIVMKTIGKHLKHDGNLCLTGGCALNGITNYKIYQSMTRNIYIPPNPSDTGISCGAALACYYAKGNNPYVPVKHQNPFLGVPILDYENINNYFSRSDYQGKVSLSDLAEILRKKHIVGVASGNSEMGPRALGNRSILCDCSSPDMRDIINNKVKFREWYRPFAPIVREEDTSKYFDFDGTSPYMSYVAPVREIFLDKIPSVCHVDGTGRLQTLNRESHQFLYDLLSKYDRLFGVGILLNTSFNIKGRAILSRLTEAFHVIDNTELDALYIDGHLWGKS